MADNSKKWYSIVNASDGTTANPCIILDGYIGQYDEINYKSFRDVIDELSKTHRECDMLINSGGGSMSEGFTIYDHMQASPMKFNVKIIGMAASMAGILVLGGDTVEISENASFMTHRPKAGAYGEKEFIEGICELLEQQEQKALAIFIKKTGQPENVVKEWFKPSVDKWFTPADCVKLKIADRVIPNAEKGTKNIAPKNFKNQEEAWQVYNNISIPNLQNITHDNTMKKSILSVLAAYAVAHSLTENSSDAEFEAVVNKAFADNAKAINDLKAAQETEVANKATTLIANAIKEGKITEAEKAKYEGFAKNNYEATADMIGKISARVDINNQLGGDGKKAAAPANGIAEDRKAWTYAEWEQKDKKGLDALSNEVHDQLFETYYGEKYER